ncbi:MAG TPA: hypothetical protein VKV04_18970 [Verrucomicrobiae bacterium]|nr:hypothetical protein [Verrucomicrobiae bacterium]
MKTIKMENMRNMRKIVTLDDLVWDCCERMRQGEKVDLDFYLNQCPDEKSRQDFQLEIFTAALFDASIALQVNRLSEKAAPNTSFPTTK